LTKPAFAFAEGKLGERFARAYGRGAKQGARRMWPDRRLIDLIGIEIPIVQAPMAGAQDWELVAAISKAGRLGSLPCAMLTPEKIIEQSDKIRAVTDRPFNLNFFCHTPPVADNAREAAWRNKLAPYYRELGIDPNEPIKAAQRSPFNAQLCEVVETVKPAVVSFHFGLPEKSLVERVKAAGCKAFGCATTSAEARWLAERGMDAIIAQGVEAGGHRGIFLTKNLAAQPGTFALVPQVVDAVEIPVIAAGGISDARGIAAAFALGAAAVQIGSAFLQGPEAKISAMHRAALKSAADDNTVLTNVLTGRPARLLQTRLVREQGPIADGLPEFPLAAAPVAPLRAKAEALGSGDFSPLWAGQSAALGRAIPAADLLAMLVAETAAQFKRLNA
jgi:nitronate monooxygenase